MTRKRKAADPLSISEILLPWYVNGSLSEAEMDQVSHQAESSPRFATRVEKEIQLSSLWSSETDELGDLLEQRDMACQKLLMQLPDQKRGAQKRWLSNYAVAAALCVGIALGSLFTIMLGNNAGKEFHTLSSPAGAADGSVLQVIFQPATTEREMRLLLLDGEARMLSGPSRQGVYRLAIPQHTDGAEYARRLKEHPAIRWAELEAR